MLGAILKFKYFYLFFLFNSLYFDFWSKRTSSFKMFCFHLFRLYVSFRSIIATYALWILHIWRLSLRMWVSEFRRFFCTNPSCFFFLLRTRTQSYYTPTIQPVWLVGLLFGWTIDEKFKIFKFHSLYWSKIIEKKRFSTLQNSLIKLISYQSLADRCLILNPPNIQRYKLFSIRKSNEISFS